MSIAIIGDYGEHSVQQTRVLSMVKSWNPALILTLGDNNYPRGEDHTFEHNQGPFLLNMIDHKKVFPVPGNHDWYTTSYINGVLTPHVYLNRFKLSRTYYDFVHKKVHFFALDSDPHQPHGNSFNSLQGKWFQRAITHSVAKYKIVYFHHHPYGSDCVHPENENTFMRWPFKQLGVDLVLCGHIHVYERLLVDDLPLVINGIGGTALRNDPISASYNTHTVHKFCNDNGAMRMSIMHDRLRFKLFDTYNICQDTFDIFPHN